MFSYKHLTRGLTAAAVLVLAMGAAQPRLRAGAKMAVLVAKHGPPMFMFCALVRLRSITKGEFPVPNEERSKATFDRLPEYAKSIVDYQYDIGKDPSSGKFPSEKIQQNFLGEVLTPNINIHDVKSFEDNFGVVIASLEDTELKPEELRPVFDVWDKDHNGVLTLPERLAVAFGSCNAEPGAACNSWVGTWASYLPGRPMSFEDWSSHVIEAGKIDEDIPQYLSS